ncbi:DUF3168 domain-containing protein [Rhizobium rhizogenes]|uniref:DUF3168 domain-containing protein n=1 Tax=Rhizobium rhizogenes TaxID=359 RepID=UPI0015733FFB|nr:DUF3168 domain-containing protein [Rhizobium rhizogenes]NTI22377.1 DUF3168 domain-containing protein [Rhizobium rhizogenes]QTG05963.1 DUF3168 domain-containing protein [Rhizobium rhizogenes]
MTLTPSLDLQDMIYRRLISDETITWPVFDRSPDNQPTSPVGYIEFGPEDIQEDDDECITGTNHQFQVDLYRNQDGMADLKQQMGLVKQSLHNYPGELTDNALHSIRYIRSTVVKEPDGINYHGVVQFEALVESDIS